MPISLQCRRLATAVFTGCAVAAVTLATPIGFGALNSAQAQVSDEFQDALAPYGEWRDHPRWGQVWVPLDRPDGWRPYTYGHWVYTDDWGWYWVSDDDEADWGWVTYHYGRWVFDRGMGWLWVPGQEWAPAWVDWRRGNDAVGWAPMPPTELAADAEYDGDPNYWIFVQPRYMMAPRLRGYVLPPQRANVVFRDTVVVNRTVRLSRERERIAVNPGIAPNIIAAVTRGAVPTYRVQPRVLAGTQGVQGAVQVRREDLVRRGPPGQPGPRGQRPSPMQARVQRTTTVIQPVATVPKPVALDRDDRGGRLGSRPPHAAQGAAVTPVQQQSPAQQQQRPVAAPAQTTPPPAATPARPPVSAPPAAQTRPEPPRPGAPQERQGERQENRQENRQERRDQRPAVSAPPAAAPQVRPERPPAPQTPPPAANLRPAAPPPAAHPPRPPETHPPAPPAVQRPVAPPPQAARPPAPPPQAHPPAPPPPHPPAPPQARPPAPAPAAARPAAPPPRPPAQAQQHPPAKPGEKPDEKK
jgi:hypothetical protein